MKKTKIIAVTQREVKIDDHSEVRDSLDRGWFGFFEKCRITPILLPNEITLVKKIFDQIKIDGILLTGGGDIKSCGGKDDKREEVEEYLIKRAVAKKIPLIAVCRGMQKIQDSFKIKLGKVAGHVVGKQEIFIEDALKEVNSFHKFGSKKNNDAEFDIFAIAKDEVVKAFKHKKHRITAIMWHPERISPYRQEDIKLFNEAFK